MGQLEKLMNVELDGSYQKRLKRIVSMLESYGLHYKLEQIDGKGFVGVQYGGRVIFTPNFVYHWDSQTVLYDRTKNIDEDLKSNIFKVSREYKISPRDMGRFSRICDEYLDAIDLRRKPMG